MGGTRRNRNKLLPRLQPLKQIRTRRLPMNLNNLQATKPNKLKTAARLFFDTRKVIGYDLLSRRKNERQSIS